MVIKRGEARAVWGDSGTMGPSNTFLGTPHIIRPTRRNGIVGQIRNS